MKLLLIVALFIVAVVTLSVEAASKAEAPLGWVEESDKSKAAPVKKAAIVRSSPKRTYGYLARRRTQIIRSRYGRRPVVAPGHGWKLGRK